MKEIYKEEGVSEVVGTILVLAITVALFATVFTYTQHIPPPSKTSQAVIYPAFSISNGHLYLNLTNKGGTSYLSNETYLIVNSNGNTHSFLLYTITNKNFFAPGDTVYLNGSNTGFNVQVSSNSSFYALLYSKQYNSIIWKSQNFIGEELSILSVQITPSPIIPDQSFTIFASIYTLSPSDTNVFMILPSSFNYSSGIGKGPVNLTMRPYPSGSNIIEYFATYSAPISISNKSYANITAYIKGVSQYKQYDNISLVGGLAFAPSLSIAKNGIIPEYVRPEHGSYDPLTIIIQNNGPVGATFNMFIYDQYPNKTLAPIQNNYGLKKVNKEEVINQTFTIGSLSSTTVNLVWLNVGGNNSTAGGNNLIVGLTNIRGQNNVTQLINPPNSTYYIYIMPKILLVNEEGVTAGTQQDVNNYYTTLLQYTSYEFKEIRINNNQNVNLSGYDVVIWFTGNNSQGLSSIQQTDLENFYNNGGRIFLVSGTDKSFPGTNELNITSDIVVNISKSAINTMHISQLKNATSINYSFMSPSFVYFSGPSYFWMQSSKPFMNITYNGFNYTVGTYSQGISGGKIAVVGFEFAKLLLYEQDYIANKILMWLANISTLSGNQLVLSDIEFSTDSPLFYQNITVTFVITNLSPTNLTTTLEMLVNGNFYEYVNNIQVPGNGGFTRVNVSWIAAPPGINIITGLVDPFHSISQIDYSLDQASSLVNTTVNVRFNTLVIWVHNNNDHYPPIGINNTLSQIGVHYDYIDYVESSSSPTVGSLNYTSLIKEFISHNLILIDFNGSGTYTSTLLGAINNFITEPHPYPGLYSFAFIGTNLGNLQGTNVSDNLGLQWSYKSPSRIEFLNGTVYDGSGNLVNFFAQNATRGYGVIYSNPKGNNQVSQGTIVEVTNPTINYAPLFETNNTNPYFSIPYNVYWNGIIENISGIRVAILPFNWEDITGFIQNHTSSFSPPATFGNSSQYARYYLMLNLLLSLGYKYPKPFPVILSSDFSINSKYITLNNHYIISGVVRNLGSAPISIVVQLYEQNSLEESQALYLPSESVVPIQFIWEPSYASSPRPEPIRFVIFNQFLKRLPSQEAIVPESVYYFYDNGSSLQNWNHYNVLAYITGESLFGLTGAPPNTDIATNFSVQNYSNDWTYIPNGWSTNAYYSYPYSYYIQDVVDLNGTSTGDYASVSLALPQEQISPGENLTLSWEWKYSIAEAQNGLFLMVRVSPSQGSGNSKWYQVSLPYNSNPDLGNILYINNCYIYQVYNGQSGGGTFSWTYHSVNTNELYVMYPNNGTPEKFPLNVVGDYVQFYFFYISPAYNASDEGGSTVPGAGTYIDNVMLAATNGSYDGWKIINPNENHKQLGVSTNGYSEIGFQGAPTKSLIAMYDNVSIKGVSGYPTFTSSLWDNLVTPIIDLYNAINASLSFTFKANIAQGLYGYGWPGDYFSISESSNYGSSWEIIYSPPTYPTPVFAQNGGQSGGGTIYISSSDTPYPANGANSTYWLTVPINMNFFLGLPILLDFSIVTNNGWPPYSYIFTPWHAVGYNDASLNPFMGFYMTNVFIQGYSQSPFISFSEFWI